MDSSDNTRGIPPSPGLFEATFANTATSPSDILLVTIAAFGELPFGDPDGVIWSPMGGVLPQEGDRALVAESDDGAWWVVQWWSAAQTDASPEAVHLVTVFSNSWVNFDATDRPARYYKANGRVYLAGIISGGTIGSTAFTLPAGYLPDVTGGKQASFAVESNAAVGFVRISSGGAVVPNIGSNAFMFLDGIDFRHA